MNKIKNKINCLTVFLLLMFTFSCDYLDVVPDNIPTLDYAFRDRTAAEKSLFSCYSYLPKHGHVTQDLAMLGGDEFYTYSGTNSLDRTMLGLTEGIQSLTDPIANYWDGSRSGKALYKGIRECNTFLEKVGEAYDLPVYERIRWEAEVKFLKAYYHYYLLRMYGAITIVDKDLDITATPQDVHVYREPFDECVEYISRLLFEAAEYLPPVIEKEATDLGRVTRSAALAVNAKLRVLAASPLFNGNTDYAGIVDKRGKKLFSQAYDVTKWSVAVSACDTAIRAAKEAGHDLYESFASSYQLNDELQQELNIRQVIFDRWNKELIWGSVNTDHTQMQKVTLPRLTDRWWSSSIHSSMAPTINVVETYYTKNGVPINEDNQLNYDDWNVLRKATEQEQWQVAKGQETSILHFDREPRFYASIGFDRGLWWGNGFTDISKTPVLEARFSEAAGIRSSQYYSITGYWAKKLQDYQTVVNGDDAAGGIKTLPAPFPIIRLADLYLLYAEALNESKEQPDQEVYEYINRVRKRAGLDGVVESWQAHSKYPDKPQSKVEMRKIIQQERLIELAMEGHRFWDLRRWKLAMTYFNRPLKAWNVYGETKEDFYNLITIRIRKFSTRDYLWPLKEDNLIVNRNLVQNYGW